MNVGSRLNVQVGSLTSETAEMLMGGVFAVAGIIGVVWVVGWGVMWLVGFPAHRKVASDSAHQRRTGHENASRWLTEDQAGVRQAPAAAPESLTVKGRARYVWLYGWLCGAAFWFAFGLLMYTDGGLGVAVAFVAVGLVNIWVAVRGFRRRIVADAHGVTIRNLLVRRVLIPWDDLRSIGFQVVNSEAMSAMYYQLKFNNQFVADVPAGGREPGQYLFDLRETLLSMQRMYSPESGPPGDAGERGGGPSVPLWVQDQDFDTLEEALRAAERHDVPADPDGRLMPPEFQTKVQGLESLRPEAQRIGALGRVIVAAASLTVFGAVYFAADRLDPELFREEGDELVYSIVLVAIVALMVAAYVGAMLADFLARRHLAGEIARRGPHDGVPGSAPREPGPRSRGPTAPRVQDGPSDDHLLDAGSVDQPQDTPDTSTPQDE